MKRATGATQDNTEFQAFVVDIKPRITFMLQLGTDYSRSLLVGIMNPVKWSHYSNLQLYVKCGNWFQLDGYRR